MRPEHCDGNHEDMGCGCFCLKCNAVWDYERKLRHLAGFARALFYACKAIGPPMTLRWVHGSGYALFGDPVTTETEAWWAWFDAAQVWVQP